MTMRLVIKNEDHARTARVRVVDEGNPSYAQRVDLAPGDSHEFWIYQGRKLEVEELATEENKT